MPMHNADSLANKLNVLYAVNSNNVYMLFK